MSRDTYEIPGYEVLEDTAKPHGNGARVLVPKDWIGEQVKIVRVSDGQSGHETRVAPVAALMYTEAKRGENASLRSALEHVVLLQSLSDIDEDIVADFEHALETPDVYAGLEHRVATTDDDHLQEFYTDLINCGGTAEALVTLLRDWV